MANEKKEVSMMTDNADSFDALLASITPDIHEKLKTAVALGRWENGEKLTPEQKANCLQAVIAYDQANLAPEQRVGYVKPKTKDCGPGR